MLRCAGYELDSALLNHRKGEKHPIITPLPPYQCSVRTTATKREIAQITMGAHEAQVSVEVVRRVLVDVSEPSGRDNCFFQCRVVSGGVVNLNPQTQSQRRSTWKRTSMKRSLLSLSQSTQDSRSSRGLGALW
jgi:hypothetical protein